MYWGIITNARIRFLVHMDIHFENHVGHMQVAGGGLLLFRDHSVFTFQVIRQNLMCFYGPTSLPLASF